MHKGDIAKESYLYGVKIVQLANGWFQWKCPCGDEISARNKGGLVSKINGHLRSRFHNFRASAASAGIRIKK
jgi:hypothetical protein